MDKFHDIKELPRSFNPVQDIFTTLTTSFKSSDSIDNPNEALFAKDMGFETYDNNRSKCIKHLIDQHQKVDYNDFEEIKYDHQFQNLIIVG